MWVFACRVDVSVRVCAYLCVCVCVLGVILNGFIDCIVATNATAAASADWVVTRLFYRTINPSPPHLYTTEEGRKRWFLLFYRTRPYGVKVVARTPFVLFLYLVWFGLVYTVHVRMGVSICVCEYVRVCVISLLSIVKTSVKIYCATEGSVTRVITVENE